MIRMFKKSESTQQLLEIKDFVQKSWINLTNPTEEEMKLVSFNTGVPIERMALSLDEDERPRVDVDEGNTLIILRIPYEVKGDEIFKVKTIPLGIIITEYYIITISLFENVVMKDFEIDKVKGFYTTKRTRFLIQILSRTNYYFLKYLDQIDNEISKIEKRLLKSLRNEEVVKLFELQKAIIYFISSISGNGHVLDAIYKGKVSKLYKDDEDLLEDIIAENKQCLEMSTNYGNVLSNTLDAYASVVSNNLNEVMKFLASLTIIISIPTIISSLYGMNVELPLQNNPFAFVFVLLFSLLFMILTALFFAKKNWL
ncbi:MAG: magnesium transporter CorA family protein [Candidatus Aenigmatarchaeota archaeon]